MADKYERVIIGAGASGLFNAAACGKTNGLLIDHSRMPGMKFLLSGNGQCNITHGGNIKDFLSCYGENGKKLRSLLYSANNKMLLDFLKELNIPTFERPDGKIFPKSLRASDVVKALEKKAVSNGFDIRVNENITGIEYYDEYYHIYTDKDEYLSKVLVIAAGGKSYPKTGSDGSMYEILKKMGIKITEISPALAPIYVQGYKYKEASGISFKNAKVTLNEKNIEKIDDLLLTHKCFSGPAMINISRYVNPGMKMTINYLSETTSSSLQSQIKETYQKEKKQIETYISKLTKLPLNFIHVILKEALIDGTRKANTLSGNEITAIANALTSHEYIISKTGGFNEAMATKGGISLDEVDLKTMQSVKYRNLFFTGEILDIDGDTGGYNLQFAYSSAIAVNRFLNTL